MIKAVNNRLRHDTVEGANVRHAADVRIDATANADIDMIIVAMPIGVITLAKILVLSCADKHDACKRCDAANLYRRVRMDVPSVVVACIKSIILWREWTCRVGRTPQAETRPRHCELRR